MRTILIVLIVLLILTGGGGYYQNWFGVGGVTIAGLLVLVLILALLW